MIRSRSANETIRRAFGIRAFLRRSLVLVPERFYSRFVSARNAVTAASHVNDLPNARVWVNLRRAASEIFAEIFFRRGYGRDARAIAISRIRYAVILPHLLPPASADPIRSAVILRKHSRSHSPFFAKFALRHVSFRSNCRTRNLPSRLSY